MSNQTSRAFPADYKRDAEALVLAFREWIAQESETRAVDLRFHEWFGVCYAGPLAGDALDVLGLKTPGVGTPPRLRRGIMH